MRNNQKYILIVFVFIIMGISGPAFSSPYDIYYDQGKVFFEAKDYPKAYLAFSTAFQLSPGNWEVDFLLGRSAFEIKNYEMAIMAFERALITNSGMIRIKLEMARAYQHLGFNDKARKLCNEVLQTNPPEIVKKNINTFLSYIDKSEQRNFLNSNIVLGFDWTDNAWASPTDSVINTTIGEVTLTGNSAQKKEDWIRNASAQINHRYKVPYQNINWTNTATLLKSSYLHEDELDMVFFGFESGLQLFTENDMLGVSFLTDLIEINNTTYQTSSGIKGFYRYQFGASLFVSPSIKIKEKRFKSNVNKNAINTLFNIETGYQFKSTFLNFQMVIEDENARDDEFSYQKYMTRFSFNRDFLWELNLFGNYNFSASSYEEASVLFLEPRDDQIHQFGIGIKKKIWESLNQQHIVSILTAYQYTQSESNIELYEYQKNQFQIMMEYQF